MSAMHSKSPKWRRIHKALVGIVAVFAVLVLITPSASAFSLSYIHKVAKPIPGSDNNTCGGMGPTTANIEVEAYNVRQTDGTISRVYKIDMDGDERSVNLDLRAARVEIDGVRQNATNNFTVKFKDENKRRDIRGVWWMGVCLPYTVLHDM